MNRPLTVEQVANNAKLAQLMKDAPSVPYSKANAGERARYDAISLCLEEGRIATRRARAQYAATANR